MATPVRAVILTWNDADDMRRAVASVLASTDVDATVVVVDNGSEFAADVAADDRVELRRLDHNAGVGGGRNAGATGFSDGVLCFVDSDARLEPACLAALSAVMTGDVAIAGPVFAGQDPAVSGGARPTIARKLARAVGLTDKYSRRGVQFCPGDPDHWLVDFVIGACMMVRADLFHEVGGFDDSDLFGPEDLEFCDRARRAGWKIAQVTDAVCQHDARRRHRRWLTRSGRRHAVAVGRYYVRRVLRRASR